MAVYILIGLGILIVFFLIKAASKSDEFKITRSVIINAPAEIIFKQMDSPHNFNKWNPWLKADPDAEVIYEGPETGIGASYSWNGRKTGIGKDTIVESVPHKKVVVELEFMKPIKATNNAGFTLTPVENGTEVTWSMWGTRNFMTKVMHTVFNMDKMIGKSFESGLENLNKIVTKNET